MEIGNLLKGFKLDKIRNVIIYSSLIILVISLLFPLQDTANVNVQKASIVFFIYGLWLWVLSIIVELLGDQAGNDENMVWLIIISWFVISLISFLKAFEIAFGLKFLSLF